MSPESTTSEAQQYSDSMIEQFHPIVAQFGFATPSWDYSPDLDIVRVQFEDRRREKAVQIDCHIRDASYSANYCRMEGEWQMCVEGKPRSLEALRATLARWIRRHCVECRTKAEEEEETEE